MDPAAFLQFCRANDKAAATSSKLQKQAAIAEYLRSLSDDRDLRLAVHYCAGRPLSASGQYVLKLGWAAVSEVVLELLKIDAGRFHDLVVRSGEIGEALSKVWPQRALSDSPPLRLEDLAEGFDRVAATGNLEQKREVLSELLSRCREAREATYLTKILFGDMRTGVQEGVLQAAIAQAFEKKLAEVRRAQLLLGDLGQVAVLARHDALHTAQFQLFHPIQFMLATPVETAEQAETELAGRAYYSEDKLDGIRAQIHKSGDTVAIYTRTMDRTEESFPDVVEQVRRLPGELLLDGEIVPWQNGQVMPFAHLQRRLGRKMLTPQILRENPCRFIAFDLLYRDGRLLMDQPLRIRRAELQALGSQCQPAAQVAGGEAKGTDGSEMSDLKSLLTQVTEVTTAGQIDQAFCRARDCRNEGLLLKDPDSAYSPGRRGKAWLKLKTHLPTFDCVVTAAEYGHGKRRSVLSDYTFAVWDRDPSEPGARLVNVGKAYTGLTDADIVELTDLFHKLSRRQWGRVHEVEPQVVLEIACDQIQKSSRHASGFAMRFPRIKRIRGDKRPQDADRLQRIIEVYQSAANFAKQQAEPRKKPDEPTLFDDLT